jgi:hypothetical protein
LGFFFCSEFGLRDLIVESKLKIQTVVKVVSFTVRKEECWMSFEGARERERGERRESFFYDYKIHLDSYSGALYIRLYCSILLFKEPYRESIVGHFFSNFWTYFLYIGNRRPIRESVKSIPSSFLILFPMFKNPNHFLLPYINLHSCSFLK